MLFRYGTQDNGWTLYWENEVFLEKRLPLVSRKPEPRESVPFTLIDARAPSTGRVRDGARGSSRNRRSLWRWEGEEKVLEERRKCKHWLQCINKINQTNKKNFQNLKQTFLKLKSKSRSITENGQTVNDIGLKRTPVLQWGQDKFVEENRKERALYIMWLRPKSQSKNSQGRTYITYKQCK